MHTHPVDPVALVAGLLFTFAGLAVIADRIWDSVDVAVITGVGVAIVGVVLAAAIVVRYVQLPNHLDDDPAGARDDDRDDEASG